MAREVDFADVADIRLGQTFRGKAEADGEKGEVKLIQIRDLSGGAISDFESLPYAATDLSKLKVSLNHNDLLLSLRGDRPRAALVHLDFEGRRATTTNQVAIIKPRQGFLDRRYLLWYMNSALGQEALRRISSGSTVTSINAKSLASMHFTLPSLSTQKKIGAIMENWLKQRATIEAMLKNGEKRLSSRALELIEADEDVFKTNH